MKTTDPPIVVEANFNISRIKLWKAITEIDQMRKWFFANIPAFEPAVGFETSFLISSPDRDFPHVWKIVDVKPTEKIVFDWSYTGFTGRGLVSFNLSDEGDQTKLTLTNTTIEDWPEDIPEFKRESAAGGWDYFINQQLKEYIDKGNL